MMVQTQEKPSEKYPWGDNITHDDANCDGTGSKDKWQSTAPVGSFPPNGYGLYDMAGNVWEWCADWYDRGYYARSPKRNPTGPNSREYRFLHERVLRGGSWVNVFGILDLRVTARHHTEPPDMNFNIGFRCAKDVTP